MTSEKFQYQPGVCNIDTAGVRWRRNLAYVSSAGFFAAIVIFHFTEFGLVFRFIVCAGFAYAAALNFIQAREHFCVFNASKRTFETSLKKTKITNDIYKDIDRKKMQSMIGRALLFAAAGGCIGLLPL